MRGLPRLRVLRDEVRAPSECAGIDGCKTCPLYRGAVPHGRCAGCTQDKRDYDLAANYLSCYQECHTCTGHNVEVTSICCRSPLRDAYMSAVMRGEPDWNKPSWQLTTRPLIELKEPGVFYVTAGSIDRLVKPGEYLVPETTELVAVSLARVWTGGIGKRTGRGGSLFVSSDLRDYLRLAKSTRLALFTVNKDDILEGAWEHELYADPWTYQRVGIDYWMPIAFSAYLPEARMQQYYQFLRTMLTLEASQAWWMPSFYYPGLHTEDLTDAGIAAVPQVLFNAQFLEDEDLLRRFVARMLWFDKRCPPHVAFWSVGRVTASFIATMKHNLSPGRRVYYVSGDPHHFATQGKEYLPNAKGRKAEHLPKDALLHLNLQRFQEHVRRYA